MVKPRSIIELTPWLGYRLFLLNNGANQKTPLEEEEDKRRFSLLETSAASSAITENILVCLTSVMFCRNFRCFPEVSFDAGNSNSRSGFQTLSINQNFSASVNEGMTLYTVPISISKQSSCRQTGSFESSDAMTRHPDRVVHDQCTESQQPMRGDLDWCTIMLSQWKRILTSAQETIDHLH